MAAEIGPQEFQVAVTAGDVQIGTLDLVVISKREYDQLNTDSELYSALYDQGVDNWEGYSDAMRNYYNGEDQHE